MRVVERTDLIMPVAESKESRMMSATIVILKDNDIPQHPHGQQYPSTPREVDGEDHWSSCTYGK